ncbi:MAG: hypothetical protein ACYCWW_20450 [Deltaproteobacteria bacterium]
MPSSKHEVLVSLFRARRSLAVELARGPLGAGLPRFRKIEIASGDLDQSSAPQHRADLVVSLLQGGKPVLALIVEVQLSRRSAKRWSWPVYVAGVRERLRCPVVLLVVTPDRGVANWARRELVLGPLGDRVQPLVFGPAEIPAVADLREAARRPELALLSLVAHAGDAQRAAGRAGFVAAEATPSERKKKLYYDFVRLVLGRAAGPILEDLMQDQKYLSAFARKYVAEGEAKGKAKGKAEGETKGLCRGLLSLLAARKIKLTSVQRARVRACREPKELERWIARAAKAESAGEIFES